MADAVSMLRQEITQLEQELAKRRHALTILIGAGAAGTRPTAATQKPRTAGNVAKRPAPQGPSLAERIVSHLTANRGKLLSTADIADALAKADKTVTRDNVQRRVSDLVKSKKVQRKEGRYGLAS